MSSAEDVIEMKSLSNELADGLVGATAKLAARAGAVMKALGGDTTENRALEFLNGRARRVDAWEKEEAKRHVEELRNRERIARENEYLSWLGSELGRLRASGEEFHGPHIDALERVLRSARGDDRPVAIPQAAEGEAVPAPSTAAE